MWILVLNDMRSSNVEIIGPVARAETREALEAFVERERVEGYRDGKWGKTFRKDGPLEWFNPPWAHERSRHFVDVGTLEDQIAEASRRVTASWAERIEVLPAVPSGN